MIPASITSIVVPFVVPLRSNPGEPSPVSAPAPEPDLPGDRDGGAGPAPISDVELVARIKAGDQTAFETVFHVYTRQLCAFASRYVGSQETAAEVVQDVFLRFWRQRSRLELRGALRSYLYRAVRNRALDLLKHAAVERRWAEEHEALTRGEPAALRSPMSPDRVLEVKTLAVALDNALAGVPERRRQIFLLRWKHGLSYAEIGAQLGITPKTVENQLARVLHYLRERLAP